MRPPIPGWDNSLWGRMNSFERVLTVAGIFVVIVLPMTLALAEVIEQAFR